MSLTGNYYPPIRGGENLGSSPEPADPWGGDSICLTGESGSSVSNDYQVTLDVPHSGRHYINEVENIINEE